MGPKPFVPNRLVVVRPPAAVPRFAPVPQVQRHPVPTGVRFAPVPRLDPPSPRGVVFAPVPVPRPRQVSIQRYKVVTAASQTPTNYGLNYDLRVSDDGRMAVRDTGNTTPNGANQFQDLYLATDVLTTSQNALVAAGSGLALAQGATSIRGKPPGNAFKRTLHKVDIQFADTPNNQSYAGCNANAWNIMGTVRNAQPTATAAHGVFKADVNNARHVLSQPDDGAAYKAVRHEITGATTPSTARKAWNDLSASDRKKAAKKFGINEYAKPKAAEAIAIFTAGHGGNSGMGHHAGVVARSGGDYITLENYAGNPGTTTPNGTSVNPNWYVRMFGAKTGQSFYEFHKTHEAADYGHQPMAIRYRAY